MTKYKVTYLSSLSENQYIARVRQIYNEFRPSKKQEQIHNYHHPVRNWCRFVV